MRFLSLFCLVLFFGCVELPEPTASELIDKSIRAHGSWDSYEDFDEISLQKNIILFTEEGAVESQWTEHQEFRYYPFYFASVGWFKDSVYKRITYDGERISYLISDSVSDPNAELEQKNLERIRAAEFVLFQPFKLKDTLAQKEYTGKRVLFDSVEVSEVKITYPKSDDVWWFYFDRGGVLVANRVLHNGRYSLIENLDFQEHDGLYLHKHRKSYFVDSLLNKKYLRAEYFYDIVE